MRKQGEEAYTPDEVAKLLKITKNTVYELIKRGDLTGFRVGNKVRVEPHDLQAYINSMKTMAKVDNYKLDRSTSMRKSRDFTVSSQGASSFLRLSGSHDFLVEQITQYVNGASPSLLLQSTYIGSLEGLMMIHRGAADIATIHLMDPTTKEYNIPFIERLFIREPITIVRLATRNQGFIVANGNPKEIADWYDLLRNDVRFVNRQRGSGTRFLLDANLAERAIFPQQINGYEQEEWTHYATAASVARGSSDIALGIETAAQKVGLSFIPLATEAFDLVFKWTPENKEGLDRLYQLICAEEFRERLNDLQGYDCSQIGEIIYEVK